MLTPETSGARVVPARREHVAQVAANMRLSDVVEVDAQSGHDPSTALTVSLDLSTSPWSVVNGDGEPLAMFGVVPSERNPIAGRVWFLATPGIHDERTQWVRQSKLWLDRIGADFEILFNVMDDRNKTARRWVEWMGFEFLWLEPDFGPRSKPFWFFARCRDEAARMKHAALFQSIREVGPYE